MISDNPGATPPGSLAPPGGVATPPDAATPSMTSVIPTTDPSTPATGNPAPPASPPDATATVPPVATPTPPSNGDIFLPPFILGADISYNQEDVDSGVTWQDVNGTPMSLMQVLANHGFNYVRLRTFLDPFAQYGYADDTGCRGRAEAYCDAAHTLEVGQAIKAAGLGFALDFHYTDTWADPGKQVIPEAWRGLTLIEDMAAALGAYTLDVVSMLAANGAKPDMVQIGNEITPGMLLDVPIAGSTTCFGSPSADRTNGATAPNSNAGWDNLAMLLNAGAAAVRSVDPAIRIIVHIENTDDLPGVRFFLDNAMQRGVDFDVLGLSAYADAGFQGNPPDWQNTLDALVVEYPDISFTFAEYNGQRTATNMIMRNLPDGRGLGTFFWEPDRSGFWGSALFSAQGQTRSALATDFAEFDTLRPMLGL